MSEIDDGRPGTEELVTAAPIIDDGQPARGSETWPEAPDNPEIQPYDAATEVPWVDG